MLYPTCLPGAHAPLRPLVQGARDEDLLPWRDEFQRTTETPCQQSSMPVNGISTPTLANRQTPVLVDFSASWCGPCKAMAPALESFAERRRNEIAVVKLDIDEAP